MPLQIKLKITRKSNADYFKVDLNDIVSIDLEDYITGVVASEVGNAHIEACKAQAIAARTFAWQYIKSGKAISDDSSSAQAFRTERMRSALYPHVNEAVDTTSGMILTYGGVPLSTCSYSASNGGRTVSSEERWGGKRAWLIAQDDPWDLAATNGKKTGHGVGMSQAGAKYAASIGKTYQEILSFYYPETTIMVMKGGNITMSTTVKASYQVTGFNQMLKEHWKYVWGSAKEGEVDCSGAFTYLYKKAGSTMYHGSNTMYRNYTTSKGKIGEIAQIPGMAVFKHRNDGKEPDKFKKDGLGNFFHVGLYVGSGQVIEAKGTAYGVVTSDIDEWSHAARLVNTEYDMDEVAESENNESCLTGIVTTESGSLNIRSGPSKKQTRIAKAPQGSTLIIKQENVNNTGWHKVSYNGKVGYVDGSFVTIQHNQKTQPTTHHYALKFHVCDKVKAEEFQKVLQEIGLDVEVVPDEAEDDL